MIEKKRKSLAKPVGVSPEANEELRKRVFNDKDAGMTKRKIINILLKLPKEL